MPRITAIGAVLILLASRGPVSVYSDEAGPAQLSDSPSGTSTRVEKSVLRPRNTHNTPTSARKVAPKPSGGLADRLESIQNGTWGARGESRRSKTEDSSEPSSLGVSAPRELNTEETNAKEVGPTLRTAAREPRPVPRDTESTETESESGAVSNLREHSAEQVPAEATLSAGGASGNFSEPADQGADSSTGGTSRRANEKKVPSSWKRSGGTTSTSNRPSASAAVKGAAEGVVLSSKGPQMQVRTSGPKAIKIDREAEYKVILANDGDVASGEVFVRVLVPDWVQVAQADGQAGESRAQPNEEGGTRIAWTVSNVPARGEQVLTLKLVPRQSRPFDLTVDWTFRPTSAAAQIEVQQPQLEISLYGPKEVLYGENAIYTITVANPGTGEAEDVTVTLNPGTGTGESKRIGILAPGQKQEMRVELVARQPGKMTINASASGLGGLQAEATQEIAVNRAEFSVTVEGPSLQFAGSNAMYHVRVANVGTAIAAESELQMRLPSGARFVGSTDGLKATAGNVTWKLTSLAPGAERVFECVCELTHAGENRFEAVLRSGDQEAQGACVTRVEAVADLKLVVNDPQGPKLVGEDVSYEIRIQNRGTKAAEKVQVVAQFSEGIEPVQASGNPAELIPGQAIFRPLARIEPGQEVTLKVTARAEKSGSLRFRAEVTCDEQETKLVAEGVTRFVGKEYLQSGSRDAAKANRK